MTTAYESRPAAAFLILGLGLAAAAPCSAEVADAAASECFAEPVAESDAHPLHRAAHQRWQASSDPESVCEMASELLPSLAWRQFRSRVVAAVREEIRIDPTAIQGYLDEHGVRPQLPPRYRLADITLSAADDEERAEARAKLDQLSEVLRDDPDRFEAIAAEISESATRFRNGRMGYVEADRLHPTILLRLEDTSCDGALIGPIDLEHAVTLLRCSGRQATRTRDAAELEAIARNALAEQVLGRRLSELGLRGSAESPDLPALQTAAEKLGMADELNAALASLRYVAQAEAWMRQEVGRRYTPPSQAELDALQQRFQARLSDPPVYSFRLLAFPLDRNDPLRVLELERELSAGQRDLETVAGKLVGAQLREIQRAPLNQVYELGRGVESLLRTVPVGSVGPLVQEGPQGYFVHMLDRSAPRPWSAERADKELRLNYAARRKKALRQALEAELLDASTPAESAPPMAIDP